MEKTKDVDISGVRYQIGKMTARDGSWIAMQILTKVLPAGLDEKVTGGSSLPAKRSEMSEQEFHNIQDHCLAVCARYKLVGNVEAALPVFDRPGKLNPDLEHDVLTVMALTAHALAFNIAPFFAEDALKPVLASFQGLNLFSASNSTSSSSAQ
jgi:hypothetical protein